MAVALHSETNDRDGNLGVCPTYIPCPYLPLNRRRKDQVISD